MSLLVDIEDIGQQTEIRQDFDTNIRTRFKDKKLTNETTDVESFIPEMFKIYIQTWGCSHNSSDSEYMAGLLAKNGFQVNLQGCCDKETEKDGVVLQKSEKFSKNEADLWVLNSCTVKNPAEDHFRNMIEDARKNDKKIVVAGCVPQGQPKATYLKGVSVIGVQQIDRVVEVVEETLKGGSVRLFGKKREAGKRLGGACLALPKIRKNPRIEILPVNTGCLNACTYCKTKHARGDLGSYQPEEILNRVDQAFEEGCVEIWLTSEDLGAYGIDLGTNIADLLEQIVEHIPAGCMLRLGMTNPPYILQHLERIAKVLAHPRVYSFIHVPVQSGSDNVLGEMRREYTREDFCNVVDTLYNALGKDNVTIATDIICGFPTETDEDFGETLSLVKEYKFHVLFTNQFFPRPGTPAAKMERVATPAEVKKRTKQIHEVFHSYQRYDNRIGDEFNVLVTEHSSDNRYLVGHSKAYEQVLLPLKSKLLGTICKVRIVESSKHSMIGELIEQNLKDICDNNIISKQPSKSLQHKSRFSVLSNISSWSTGDLLSLFCFVVFIISVIIRIGMVVFK